MLHLEVLKKDEVFAAILPLVAPYQPKVERDVYFRLMRSIAGQQLSVKVAAVIWGRFLGLFPNGYPEKSLVIDMDIELMKSAGLSLPKSKYMKNIAGFFSEHDVTFEKLEEMGDEDAISYLSQIKGVGKWTVEMLLMFGLGRENVFPVDDLGIITSMKKLYNLSEEGKDLKIRCIEIAERWKPYRSYACFYLWPYKDLKVTNEEKIITEKL